MRTSRILIVALLIIFAIVAWRIVDNGVSETPPVSETPAVTIGASNFPIYDIVRKVGGEAVNAVQIVPTGADPHTFEPSPSTVTMLNEIDVVYGLNNEYDEWIADFLGAETDFVSLASEIATRALHDGDEDPHVWLTLPNAKVMAEQAMYDLSERFPAHQTEFRTNYAEFAAELDSADQEIRTMLENVKNTSIVTGHDAWYYFADEYGLSVLGTFEEDHGTEPSVRHLQTLAREMRETGISTIFADAGAQSDALQQFARDNGFTILIVDPEGSQGYNSYIQMMKTNAETFSNNR